jgi:hypothetical protein
MIITYFTFEGCEPSRTKGRTFWCEILRCSMSPRKAESGGGSSEEEIEVK